MIFKYLRCKTNAIYALTNFLKKFIASFICGVSIKIIYDKVLALPNLVLKNIMQIKVDYIGFLFYC